MTRCWTWTLLTVFAPEGDTSIICHDQGDAVVIQGSGDLVVQESIDSTQLRLGREGEGTEGTVKNPTWLKKHPPEFFSLSRVAIYTISESTSSKSSHSIGIWCILTVLDANCKAPADPSVLCQSISPARQNKGCSMPQRHPTEGAAIFHEIFQELLKSLYFLTCPDPLLVSLQIFVIFWQFWHQARARTWTSLKTLQSPALLNTCQVHRPCCGMYLIPGLFNLHDSASYFKQW